MLLRLILACDGEPMTEVPPYDGFEAEPPAPRPRERLPEAPELAPALALTDAETGALWSLQGALDPEGTSCPRAVLLAFLAADCEPCQQGLPVLRRLEQEQPELELVAVLVDEQSMARDAQLRQWRTAGLLGPAVVADAATTSAWAGKRAAPLLVFVDRHGRITSRNERFDDIVEGWLPRQAQKALQ
jgi:thiol-disulfide isomerase/thioredoxin